MKALQLHQATADIGQARSWMETDIPLDQGRYQPIPRQVAVRRHRDAPSIVAPLHRQNVTQRFGAGGDVTPDVVAARHPVNQSRSIWRAGIDVVEAKPARSTGWQRKRVDRNQLEVETLPKQQQAVVRTHPFVATTGG